MKDLRYQVFVSSTFCNLEKERRAVLGAIQELGHIPDGMELFSASNATPWEVIQKSIDNSDYYILIIGGRYGSSEGSGGISYTEREFDYAERQNKPILAFLHKDIGRIPSSQVEMDPIAREKLVRFRQKAERHHCKYWSKTKKLQKSVVISLTKEIALNPGLGWVRRSEIDLNHNPAIERVRQNEIDNNQAAPPLLADLSVNGKRGNNPRIKDLAKEKLAQWGAVAYLRNLSLPRPILAFFLMIIMVGQVFVWTTTYDERVLTSLNKAYEKARPFETRISSLNYAPHRVLRNEERGSTDIDSLYRATLLSQRAAAENPSAEALNDLGRVYLAQKDFDNAIKLLQGVLMRDPTNAQVLSDLGTAYLEKGQAQEDKGNRFKLIVKAFENFDRALSEKPDMDVALFNKARCLEALPFANQAKEAWREYLKRDSTTLWATEARKHLEDLEEQTSGKMSLDQFQQAFLDAAAGKNEKAFNASLTGN